MFSRVASLLHAPTLPACVLLLSPSYRWQSATKAPSITAASTCRTTATRRIIRSQCPDPYMGETSGAIFPVSFSRYGRAAHPFYVSIGLFLSLTDHTSFLRYLKRPIQYARDLRGCSAGTDTQHTLSLWCTNADAKFAPGSGGGPHGDSPACSPQAPYPQPWVALPATAIPARGPLCAAIPSSLRLRHSTPVQVPPASVPRAPLRTRRVGGFPVPPAVRRPRYAGGARRWGWVGR